MDQIQPIIAWLKKNYFWLVCGILLAGTIATWFVSTGSLAALQKKNESEVKSNVSGAKAILDKTPVDLPDVKAHPNSASEEGMKAELSKTLDAIVAAWKLRVKAQEDILVWPKVIDNDRFKQVFNRFAPELFPSPWDPDIDALLGLYQVRIGDHMNYLCGDELLRTNWKYDPANFPEVNTGDTLDPDNGDLGGGPPPGFGGGRGGGPPPGFGGGRGGGPPPGFGGGPGTGMGAMMDQGALDLNRFAVVWSDVNQDLWYAKLNTFQGIDDNIGAEARPTPLQCYMLQQDLWLLEAMFRIIRDINGNSTANDLSVIKQIDHIAFGREAVKQLGELTAKDARLANPSAVAQEEQDPSAGFGGPDDYGMDQDMEPPDFGGGRGGPGGPGGPGLGVSYGGTTGKPPFHNRYVDTNLKPLSSQKVKAVVGAKELPESNLELIIAKRVPVRIALKMDERRIGDFMAACANSPFAFEIQQVRINKHTPGGEAIPLGGYGEEAAGGADKMNQMNNSIGNNAEGPVGNQDQSVQPIHVRTNYDVNVEFFGIVKIYNPVNEKLLRAAAGLEEGAEGQPTEPAAAKESAAVVRQPVNKKS